MVELPGAAEQKAFYKAQREELLKINLQNEYTRLRAQKRLDKAVEEGDDEIATIARQELKKVETEFAAATLYLEVIDEQLA